MNKEQIIEFINKNRTCYLATCEGKQPRVRGMLTYKADKDGIVFHAGRSNDDGAKPRAKAVRLPQGIQVGQSRAQRL